MRLRSVWSLVRIQSKALDLSSEYVAGLPSADVTFMITGRRLWESHIFVCVHSSDSRRPGPARHHRSEGPPILHWSASGHTFLACSPAAYDSPPGEVGNPAPLCRGGTGFPSCTTLAFVAQRIGRPPPERETAGSNPVEGTVHPHTLHCGRSRREHPDKSRVNMGVDPYVGSGISYDTTPIRGRKIGTSVDSHTGARMDKCGHRFLGLLENRKTQRRPGNMCLRAHLRRHAGVGHNARASTSPPAVFMDSCRMERWHWRAVKLLSTAPASKPAPSLLMRTWCKGGA